MSARFDLFQYLPRLAGIFTGGDVAGGRDAIEKMMRGAGALGRSGLGGSEIELAVHRDRIAVHDLAAKAFGECERQRGSCRWPWGSSTTTSSGVG